MTTSTTRRPIEPLTKKEFWLLVDAAKENKTVGGLRDAALLALLGGAGLRLQEALALHVRDIDTRNGRINVRHGKGAKQRTVSCAPSCLAVVREWLKEREQQGLGASGLVICGFSARSKGKPVAQQYVDRMMKQLADYVGVEKRVHPHGLRHSLTLWLAEDGVPIHAIKALLGHTSLRTTDHYLSVIYPEQVLAAVQKFNV